MYALQYMIGEDPGGSLSTWASIRAPLFVSRISGHGFAEEPTYPDNWSNFGAYYEKHDSGYLEQKSGLIKAVPFYGGQTVNFAWSTYSTNVGVNFEYISSGEETSTYDVFLAVGFASFPDGNTEGIRKPEQVLISDRYDYETTKSRLLGGVVSVNIEGYGTYYVTIDDNMFPVNYYPLDDWPAFNKGGTFIDTIEIPNIPGSYPEYTVNYVDLPA